MINIFSRDNMITHITNYGVLPNEYYISVLPTGGPKGGPIFENSNNIITLVFDDVVKDSIKDKWPHGDGTFIAKAMTVQQAEELCSFIKKIPVMSIINIHCVEGKSRSVAIAAAINNEPEKGNSHVYKLMKERLHDDN